MASHTVPRVQCESINAAGSLANMFDGATAANTTYQRMTDAQTGRSDTPLNSDQSFADTNQPTDDVGRDASQARASSSPGPSARHRRSRRGTPVQGVRSSRCPLRVSRVFQLVLVVHPKTLLCLTRV